MSRKLLVFRFLMIAIMFFTHACQKDNSEDQKKADLPKVAIAYALGGKGDLSYNDAAEKGATLLKSKGYEVHEFEPSSLEDYSKGLDLLSIRDLDVIFCVGFLYDDPVLRIAKNHPSKLYFVLDGSAVDTPNVSSIKFNAMQGSFLAGVVAAYLTESSKIAFVGGANIPIINEFLDGFRDGSYYVDPEVTVLSFYIGTGGPAFTDPVKGREVALTAINKGVDIIYHAAGSSGNGVIKAAQEKNIYAIGVDVDQRFLAPKTVITSMQKNFDVAMSYVMDALQEGNNIAGEFIILGIDNNGVSLSPLPDSLAEILSDDIESAKGFLLDKESE